MEDEMVKKKRRYILAPSRQAAKGREFLFGLRTRPNKSPSPIT
jgi:hypothetical protein